MDIEEQITFLLSLYIDSRNSLQKALNLYERSGNRIPREHYENLCTEAQRALKPLLFEYYGKPVEIEQAISDFIDN